MAEAWVTTEIIIKAHGSRTYCVSCPNLNSAPATLASQVWTPQQLFPHPCRESKKRWHMIKQTAQYSRHSPGSPQHFPIGNHILDVSTYPKAEVGRGPTITKNSKPGISALSTPQRSSSLCATRQLKHEFRNSRSLSMPQGQFIAKNDCFPTVNSTGHPTVFWWKLKMPSCPLFLQAKNSPS